jgi:hypothetical protein
VNQLLVQQIWQRAGHRCEYCRIPHPHYRLPFQVDHIIARQHGGETILANLAMACFHCNRFKGPNIAGLDPASRELIRLFHPRTDLWTDHFQFDGAWLLGLTPVGRVTIHVLAMNADDLLLFRAEILKEGIALT